MIDFKNIEYLKSGTKRQTEAYETLTKNKVLEVLAEFDPILVGTIPINIDIGNSDLDIVCYWQNKNHFIKRITSLFKDKTNFKISETIINQEESVLGSFILDDFEIEIFGQNIPTENQNGYRHMIIEHQILQSRDENFRKEIIKLKQNGYKTEPAFGKLLGLKKDPYLELLKYKI
ncbi:DUF4269 domain-containing protein [Flavobacterium sp. KACC 22761]|uniref:DUF4269 domain-containing protein n=1 Tax=Flavobacterium sp. KACC 22761 TaxID=3092665 RepID=UPI002A75FE57|nr:DUF4269 domain-containing protein [Flavobacterium sp. KACC 22761]WPO76855.1 DUF4269 domain-containing protein [Flavobacterium sp. KACC 22761]